MTTDQFDIAIILGLFALAGLLLWGGWDGIVDLFRQDDSLPKRKQGKRTPKAGQGTRGEPEHTDDQVREWIANQPRLGTKRADDGLGTYTPRSGSRAAIDDGNPPKPFGGGSAETSRARRDSGQEPRDPGGVGASSAWASKPKPLDTRDPGWPPGERKVGGPDPVAEGIEPRKGVESGRDIAELVVAAWRDAWASEVVSVRSLVDRMGQVPGARGVNVLAESSVVVVRFDDAFLAVPSQQDYELCEKLFEADRPPGRFATVIDLERAAVVAGTNGEVVQRGMLRIECG